MTVTAATPRPTRLRRVARRPPTRPARIEPPAAEAGPPALDTLNNHWRGSFDASAEALAAARECERELGFARGEIGRMQSSLAANRAEIARLLDALSDDLHVTLRHPLSAPHALARMLGLPPRTRACIFDLDGVLTGSASVHAAAWREVLDAFLLHRAEASHDRYAVRFFDLQKDYYGLIHGKPRMDGLRAFLGSRGITLPEGHPGDPPGGQTLHALANRKNAVFTRQLARDPAHALHGAHRYLEAAREAGLARVVISPSLNTRAILARAEIASLVTLVIDGRTMEHEGLAPKPAPDAIAFACRALDTDPARVAVFETMPAGVTAALDAGVGWVVGVDRHHAARLAELGANRVAADLSELLDPALVE